MGTSLFAAIALSSSAWLAQTAPATQPEPTRANVDKPLVLVGCVAPDRTDADRFTLSDSTASVTYRLRGSKLGTYSGRRVRIVGGLYPSANIAAQGGPIDPTKFAIAAAGPRGAGVAPAQPIEFNVTRVRTVAGSCPPR